MRRRFAFALALLGMLAGAAPAAAERVKIAAFQGTFVNLPVYMAVELGLFQKHGIEAELLYGTGIQVTNIMLSGSADFGGFAVEHGLLVASKGQDIRLLVLNQTLTPFGIIVRNDVATPNAGGPWQDRLRDLKGLRIGITTPGASTDQTLRFLLAQAGLDPQKDVRIVPVGAVQTMIAGLKNGLVDANMAVEPVQSEAVLGQKIARTILDIQGGEGPDMFHDYAYNGMFARGAYLKAHAETARGIVAAIVEAEEIINDPARRETALAVAVRNMRGLDPALLAGYLERYHGIFAPVATPRAIANVNQVLLGTKQIEAPVPYEGIVAQDFMPRDFAGARPK
jgi:NitT/TauT family transport system substrate-binding protein